MRKMLKLFVRSLHMYQENENGPVPLGLWALSEPFWLPVALQKMKI